MSRGEKEGEGEGKKIQLVEQQREETKHSAVKLVISVDHEVH